MITTSHSGRKLVTKFFQLIFCLLTTVVFHAKIIKKVKQECVEIFPSTIKRLCYYFNRKLNKSVTR